VWAGLLLSLLFAWLAVRGIDAGELRDALGRHDYVFLLPAAAALAVAVALRAWRWQLVFGRETRPPFPYVLNALLVGYLFNTILPARAGELARVQVLGRRSGVSRANVLATVVLERTYDLLVLVALLALASPFLPPVGWLSAAVALGFVLGIVLVAAALVVRRFGGRAARKLLRPLAWLPGVDEARARRVADNAVHGLATLRVTRLFAIAVAVTAASWLMLAGSTWLLLLGTDLDVGFGAALLVVVATNLVLVLPSSPAALGAFEAAAVLALAAYGVEREEALSFALVLHALNALPYIPLGYAALALHSRALPS
jgi:glycosyltransferase 2 family protein